MRARCWPADTPRALIEERGAQTLEEAFIAYMEDSAAEGASRKAPASVAADDRASEKASHDAPPASALRRRFERMRAYARNETLQILRDPVRLAFAFVGSALLMLVFGFGITTDVEHIRYASLDLDQSPESHMYLDEFAGAERYFSANSARPLGGRGARAAPVGRRLVGHRDPTCVRQGLPSRLRAGGARAGRRRHDLPRRHRCAVRAGGTRDGPRGPGERPPVGRSSAALGRHRGTVHVQPHVRERLLDRAERPGPAAAPDTGDPHDGEHRSREGARVDHQLLRHADGQARIPRSASSSPTSRSG